MAFNEMLAQIQQSEESLRMLRDELELTRPGRHRGA